jgi:hypothetical protein
MLGSSRFAPGVNTTSPNAPARQGCQGPVHVVFTAMKEFGLSFDGADALAEGSARGMYSIPVNAQKVMVAVSVSV